MIRRLLEALGVGFATGEGPTETVTLTDPGEGERASLRFELAKGDTLRTVVRTAIAYPFDLTVVTTTTRTREALNAKRHAPVRFRTRTVVDSIDPPPEHDPDSVDHDPYADDTDETRLGARGEDIDTAVNDDIHDRLPLPEESVAPDARWTAQHRETIDARDGAYTHDATARYRLVALDPETITVELDIDATTTHAVVHDDGGRHESTTTLRAKGNLAYHRRFGVPVKGEITTTTKSDDDEGTTTTVTTYTPAE